MYLKPFNILIKPVSGNCNLSCEYCYYLNKPHDRNSSTKMSTTVLRALIKKYLSEHPGHEVYFIWQGGEPLLAGLSFFEEVIEYQQDFNIKNKVIKNIIQTNATLINNKWASFLKNNNFLVGVSLDGPEHIHNIYRKNNLHAGSFNSVLRGVRKLQDFCVDINILCTVNNINCLYPDEVYNFFVMDIGIKNIQFIPVIETSKSLGPSVFKIEEKPVSDIYPFSISPSGYSYFINRVFDIWSERDYGSIFIQLFENVFSVYYGVPATLCVMCQDCGNNLIVENNGDIYCCDHFVYHNFRLGNICSLSFKDIVNSNKNLLFSTIKTQLPDRCRACKFISFCFGGCPKHRITKENNGVTNYLCSAYIDIFAHITDYISTLEPYHYQRK